jgi:hypothetical protein
MAEGETFSIRVVDENGDPVRSAKVSCAYGSMSGVGTEYTDSDGWAEFPIIDQVLGGGAIRITTIWIKGKEVSDETFVPSDGDTFSFTITR